jgi:hypothetical protein
MMLIEAAAQQWRGDELPCSPAERTERARSSTTPARQDLSVEEFRKRARLLIEALNHALAAIPPERVRMHLCWGNYEGPHHHDVPLAAHIGRDRLVDRLLVEPAHQFALIERCRRADRSCRRQAPFHRCAETQRYGSSPDSSVEAAARWQDAVAVA